MRKPIGLLLSTLLMLAPVSAMALPEIGKHAPDFKTVASDGASVSAAGLKGKVVVLEWSNPGCPFVHKHYDSGSMQKLQAYARDKGVVWLTVNSSAPDRQGFMKPEIANELVKSQKINSAHYILDPEGTIGRLYGAKSTPHMFVIDTKGNLAYMGAIDSNPSPDPAALNGADNYVRDAIDSLLTGKPVKVASTQSYGCSVKYAD